MANVDEKMELLMKQIRDLAVSQIETAQNSVTPQSHGFTDSGSESEAESEASSADYTYSKSTFIQATQQC